MSLARLLPFMKLLTMSGSHPTITTRTALPAKLLH